MIKRLNSFFLVGKTDILFSSSSLFCFVSSIFDSAFSSSIIFPQFFSLFLKCNYKVSIYCIGWGFKFLNFVIGSAALYFLHEDMKFLG